TFYLPVPRGRFKGPEQISPYYRQLLEKIEAIPGVETATVTTGMPLRGPGFGMAFRLAGAPPAESRSGAGFQMVTPGYFETFGVRVLKGRPFTEQDAAAGPRVALVNETFVNRYLPDADPLGQRVVVNQLIPGSPNPGPEVEWQIVGVFHNTRGGEGLRDDYPVIYVPFWQSPQPRASVAVRTTVEPEHVTQ